MTDALITTAWFIGLVLIVVPTLGLVLRIVLVTGFFIDEVFADRGDAPVCKAANDRIAARNVVSLAARRSHTAIDLIEEGRAAA